MSHRKLGRVVAALALAVLIAIPVAALGAPPPKKNDQLAKVVAELDMDYARYVIETMCAMGDSDIGFRGAGGPADREAALWIAEEMRRLKLLPAQDTNGAVKAQGFLEEVPLDAWEFRGAWVYVPALGTTMTAASFGGFPATDGEMTYEMIWLGNGYKSDYDLYLAEDPEYSFEEKIGLINWVGYEFWSDSIAVEAMLHKLAGIVLTTIDCNVGQGYEALSCHDGLALPQDEYPDFPPLVSISKENGSILKEMLLAGETFDVTIYSDIVITRMKDGGMGYNVVGYLPGKNWNTVNDEYLIIGPHHDAWFYGAMDDTSGVAAMLVLADAFMDAIGPNKLDRTIVFTSHTAEEYGLLNTYYDWCWGANYQIIEAHPEWVRKSVAYLCLELMGMAGVPVYINCPPELYSFVKNVLGQNRANLPYGASADPRVHTWADHWTFTAAGIPGIEFETVNEEWEALYYHSSLDAPDIIDYDYMRQLCAILADMSLRLLTYPIVPYNFETYSKQLDSALYDADDFGVAGLYKIYDEHGIDPAANLDRTLYQADLFGQKAKELNSALSRLKGPYNHGVNTQLMSIAGTLDSAMVAMGVWEQDWFPYQQPINDVYHLYEALQILTTGAIDDDKVSDAVWELNWVGIIWYYDYMSYENYMDQYERLTGDRKASWGLQNHLQPAIELWAEYDALVNLQYNEDVTWDDIAWIVESLEERLLEALGQLEAALGWMHVALEDANGQIDALIEDL